MRLPLWRHVRQRLSTQVVLLMVAILVLTMSGGFYVLQRDLREQLDTQFEYRALSIAQTLAAEPSVANVRLLQDYLAWESRPLLRRRATALLRRMEQTLIDPRPVGV